MEKQTIVINLNGRDVPVTGSAQLLFLGGLEHICMYTFVKKLLSLQLHKVMFKTIAGVKNWNDMG